jgi:hypothetical protein
MNFFSSLVLVLASVVVFASEPESCKAGKEGGHDCGMAKEAAHHEGGHGDKEAKMNALFPGKIKDPSKSNKPMSVELVAPKFLESISGTSVKLNWKESSAASAYHVQVASDPNFKWLVSNDQNVKGTSFDVNALESGKKYYWRVAARSPDNDPLFTKSNFVSSAFQTK